MLKKHTILIDRESGEEWRIDVRTPGNVVQDAEGKPVKLYVYVLSNKELHRRFVYEHQVDRDYTVKQT
jgi:hypothetical protein